MDNDNYDDKGFMHHYRPRQERQTVADSWGGGNKSQKLNCSSCFSMLQNAWRRISSITCCGRYALQSLMLHSLYGRSRNGVATRRSDGILYHGNGIHKQQRRTKSQSIVTKLSSSSLSIVLMFFIGFFGYFVFMLILSAFKSTAIDPSRSSPNLLASIYMSDPLYAIVMTFRSLINSLSFQYKHCKYGWVTTAGCYKYGFVRKTRSLSDIWHGCGLSPMSSGFCLCDEYSIAAASNCGHRPVLCEKECKTSKITGSSFLRHSDICMSHAADSVDKALQRTDYDDDDDDDGPRNCVEESKKSFFARLSRKKTKKKLSKPKSFKLQRYSSAWKNFMTARGNRLGVRIPGSRTAQDDFVLKDIHMSDDNIKRVKDKVDSFMLSMDANSYENGNIDKVVLLGDGRGVVIVGGSGKFRTPFWVALHALRRTGCTLPVELWFPEGELPTCSDKKILRDLGATVRSFNEFNNNDRITLDDGSRVRNRKLSLSRFMFKSFALMFSSFSEILMIDADNVPIKNPEFLFSSEMYVEHGAIFWQDYWLQSSAPETYVIFGNATRMTNTHESGQMVVNKEKHWNALWLNLYMNSFNNFFYPLSVNYMGLGDKELLPFAIASQGDKYGLIPHGPDHIGVLLDNRIYGNTMLQFDVYGEPLFLHANLGKWTTNVPMEERNWIRRWQHSILYGSDIVKLISQYAGDDLEYWIYSLIRSQYCLFKPRRESNEWLNNIGIGPFLEGIFLADHYNGNTDLEVFIQSQCVTRSEASRIST